MYFDIDFDGVTVQETIDEMSTMINIDCVKFLVTRGGFHALIKLDDVDKKYEKTWYQSIIKLYGVDMRGDNLIPMAGTYQGGFTPHIMNADLSIRP
jgi:hypothetical protein